MKKENYVYPYDKNYSKNYENLWINYPLYKNEKNIILRTLSNYLIDSERTWLDAGCGTGFFLNYFNQIKTKAGFDKSETMLEIAKSKNSNTLFLEQHDISNSNSKWNNQWDIVSCVGQPWSYLANIQLIEKTVYNLYNWTSIDGICILTPDEVIHKSSYDFLNNANASFFLNATIHSYIDHGCGEHKHLIFPFIDQWVIWFSKYFKKINLNIYDTKNEINRKCYVLICENKKSIPNNDDFDIYINDRNISSYFIDNKQSIQSDILFSNILNI